MHVLSTRCDHHSDKINVDIKELCAINRDIQTYIDSCKKERAANTEQNTLHLENVARITVDSDSITPQKKQKGREEYHQEDYQIPLNENEENQSIIAIRTIESNVGKTIEPNASETIEQKNKQNN